MSKLFKLFLLVVTMLAVTNLAKCVPSDEYGQIVDEYAVESPYNDGLTCTKFVHEHGQVQVICFDEAPAPGWMVWAQTVTSPAYYIEDGVHHTLFF